MIWVLPGPWKGEEQAQAIRYREEQVTSDESIKFSVALRFRTGRQIVLAALSQLLAHVIEILRMTVC